MILVAAGIYYAASRMPKKIGGDLDAHGCLTGSGYGWCEAKEKCLRTFEETCTASEAKTVGFVCEDNKALSATFYKEDKTVDVTLDDGRKFAVPHAISGSGARYANSDESFVFWNKGDTAFITENNSTTYSNCVLNPTNILDGQQARQVVDDFGKKLKNVSLLAPKDQLENDAKTNYSGLVADELLNRWLKDTSKMPGRKVSSPWPEKIEVETMSFANEEFDVQGAVIEMTSESVTQGREAGRYAIELKLKQINGKWQIVEVK